jgi:hypothetical protein
MWKAILGGVLAVVILAAVVVGLYYGGGDDQSFLERSRDIVIVLFGLLMVVATILLVVAIGALALLIIIVRQKIVPIMERIVGLQETTLETLQRVKGTTDFVTEEVAAPIISVYGTVAKGRTMIRTVTGRDKGSERKTSAKLLK